MSDRHVHPFLNSPSNLDPEEVGVVLLGDGFVLVAGDPVVRNRPGRGGAGLVRRCWAARSRALGEPHWTDWEPSNSAAIAPIEREGPADPGAGGQ